MLTIAGELVCQLFHGRWVELVSYSRQGAWRCTKPDCAAQASHEAEVGNASSQPPSAAGRWSSHPSSSRSARPHHRAA
jgi:hypothetical protein